MTVIFPIQRRRALFGVGAARCSWPLAARLSNPPSKSSPVRPRQDCAIEDLKKDLKPPVVVKPGVAPTTETVPVAPIAPFSAVGAFRSSRE